MKALFIAFLLLCTMSLTAKDLKVAIFGTGKRPGIAEEYDKESLAKILRQIKEQEPDMVIFTGHLIHGLEQSTSLESLEAFQNHLNSFSSLVKTYLGEKIPLYPIMGNHAIVNSLAVKIFQTHFAIKSDAPLEPYQLAYVIKVKNTKFTFMATGEYERKFPGYRQYQRYMPLFDWLAKELKTVEEEIDFRFVIGHEPAYSSDASGGVYTGLDKRPQRRDAFWKILKSNRVLGYFCSHELIYDRSNRGGVWQIISGGVGNPLVINDGGHMFQHFVLLSIPESTNENPVAKAIDLNGKVWDAFELQPIDRPVHHLRISKN